MALLTDLAEMKLLNEPNGPLDPRMIIVHTMDGFLAGTDSHFRHSTGVEAHFGIGGPADQGLDGAIWQWVDTARTADANFKANGFALSIETSDGTDHSKPWSPKQVDALVRLMNRLCELHGIPKRVVTAWDDPVGGIGWHTQFGAPSNWAKVAKTCPGDVRIAQLHNEVFQTMGMGASPVPTPVPAGPADPPWPGLVFKRRASKGPEVCRIQERLRSLGFAIDRVAGCPFGPQTEAAVMEFQRRNGMNDHGRVGEDTWNKLFAR